MAPDRPFQLDKSNQKKNICSISDIGYSFFLLVSTISSHIFVWKRPEKGTFENKSAPRGKPAGRCLSELRNIF